MQRNAAQSADQLVAIVRSRGSDATDARDAAHEACHAIQWGVRGKWTRDNIHRRAPRVPGFGVADEIKARAVEALICQRLGIDYDLPKWAMVCWMEQLKNERVALPSGSWLEDRIREQMGKPLVARFVEKVLALEPKRPRRKADPRVSP